MKIALTTLISASLLSVPALANNFDSQHRVGIGYSKTQVADWLSDSTVDWGNGIKLEYGYEFNHIVGINVAYATNSDDETVDGLKADIDGSKFQVDADIGYKFDLDGFSIKPYGLIGLARHSEDISLIFAGDKETVSFNDTSIIVGIGGRAEFGRHVYTDMRFEFASYDGADYDTFSWTVGYRF
ncbi:porin family protein [Vibrio maerlii]|uniref:porin family protein n=1 Tax=Vibrio maerlii TaxID=2231648 RepID=UPI000E3E8FA8|nr:porin family protein [Vibrio maerlii]